MTTALLEYPKVLLTGSGRLARVPSWMSDELSPEVATTEEIRKLPRLPELTVVRAMKPEAVLAAEDFLTFLAERLERTPTPAKILFVFEGKGAATDPETLLRVLRFFHRPEDVEFALGGDLAAFAVNEALAKIWVDLGWAAGSQLARDPDPLGRLKRLIAATADLRATSGRLSAKKVAAAFGLSLAELAQLIGRPRQSLWKTDDAEAVQQPLFPFERVARLRAVLSEAEFRNWLHMANDQLDGHSPLQLIRQGKVAMVADLVEDMLSGSPA